MAATAAAALPIAVDPARFTVGFGNCIFISSIVWVMIWEMDKSRNHLWFEGMMNQGACSVLVLLSTSSNASM